MWQLNTETDCKDIPSNVATFALLERGQMLVKRSITATLFFSLQMSGASAERGSLFNMVAVPLVEASTSGRTLFDFQADVGKIKVSNLSASLFSDRMETSFFAPYPVRRNKEEQRPQLSRNALQAIGLRHLIASAEAGKEGYDAVQHGAKTLPPLPATQMTINEIYAWIEQTPNQPHAIGRYQFIPMTLKRLVGLLGATENTLFTPTFQDELANTLLVEAGLNAFTDGVIERHDFMNNLAKIWAGLPTSSGLSYYDGYAGNKATMTWDQFDREMAKLFP